MKTATAIELPEEQAIFNKAWTVLKKYYYIAPENETEEIWQEIVDETNAIYSIGQGTTADKLGLNIGLAIVEHIEKLYKERKERVNSGK